jgi:hypothetical protein
MTALSKNNLTWYALGGGVRQYRCDQNGATIVKFEKKYVLNWPSARGGNEFHSQHGTLVNAQRAAQKIYDARIF